MRPKTAILVFLVMVATFHSTAAQVGAGNGGNFLIDFGPSPGAELLITSTAAHFQIPLETAGSVLTISSPSGIVVQKTFDAVTDPVFSLEDLGAEVEDGIYSYRLMVLPILTAEQKALMQTARGDLQQVARMRAAGHLPPPSPVHSGFFMVTQGVLVEILPTGGNPTADAAVFSIETGAPKDALHVDSTGRVGFGTSSPAADLHRISGNTPTLRLEQDASAGLDDQTWEVAGNDDGFFVRDVTDGSKLPFKIEPGAPTSSIFVAASGNIGLYGEENPEEELHIRGTDNPRILIEDIKINSNDKPGFVLRSPASASSGDWFFEVANNGNFQIDFTGNGGSGAEIIFTDETANNSSVTINGALTVNGVFSNPSSRTLKRDFAPVDVTEVLEQFVALPIQTWSYTADPTGRRHMGTFTEEFDATFGLGTQGTHIIPLDVQGVTMAAVQGLHQQVQQVQQRAAELEAKNASLAARVAELEAMIERLTATNPR